ncbi:glutathione S-transferase N-terminal domain-containing protein [Actibacterium sp.]|uniref:glutathione S-transferase N-terminal domain-containing protein n=1 Tax=Actibacterium sp. TaxID=1872125 RepID=UPI003561FC0D
MTSLSDFTITHRWPPRDPDAIQYYGRTTPNGIKVSVMLEELGLPYDAHHIRFEDKDQFSPEFLSISPNNKIPAIIDPHGPGDQPLALFESGAILLYLAEKTGRLLSLDPATRYHTIQWLMFQMGGVGPMFGQAGWFLTEAGKDMTDRLPHTRYINESKRLLAVLDKAMDGKDWIMGDYSIADIAIAPWLKHLTVAYGAAEHVDWTGLRNMPAYLDRFLARPAVQRGYKTPPRK